MKITRIEVQKKNKNRASIYIDDEYAFGINAELIYELSLNKGDDISEDYIQEVIKREELSKANNYAINIISYRIRSEKEVIDKMKLKDYDASVIEKTISYLKGINLIDDVEYAHCYTRDKMNLNNYGPNKIKTGLYTKGIDKEIIENVLAEYQNKDNEYDSAKELALKKLNILIKNNKSNKYKLNNAIQGYLLRKGYSYDISAKIIKDILKSNKYED